MLVTHGTRDAHHFDLPAGKRRERLGAESQPKATGRLENCQVRSAEPSSVQWSMIA